MWKCTNKITMVPTKHHENPENNVKFMIWNIFKSHTRKLANSNSADSNRTLKFKIANRYLTPPPREQWPSSFNVKWLLVYYFNLLQSTL
jgi:hypothetical protein